MKIMFAITSQAHNLNKFAFLLNAVKDKLQQRLPCNLLFPSSDPTAIIQLKIDGAQLMIQLACLCPCLLCVCPTVLCIIPCHDDRIQQEPNLSAGVYEAHDL